MPYMSAREVVRKSTFIPQAIMTMCINFGINFGVAWATYSNWGKNGHDYASWPTVAMWRLNPVTNSCLALDMTLTAFLIAYFCTLLGSNGAQKDVKDKKCDVIDSSVTAKGWWRYTPVGIHNLCLRSAAMGLYFWTLAGVPTLLLLWAGVRGGEMSGIAYVSFKGVWATFTAFFVYVLVYFAAIDKRNFPEIEFESLVRMAGGEAGAGGAGGKGDADAPPLVGNIGHV
jgi:hypothetical protein